MTGGKFFPKLSVNSDGVVEAGGPLENLPDQVVEMCVWVYQRAANGNDAIANKMDDGPGLTAHEMNMGAKPGPSALKIEPMRNQKPMWRLDLDDRMNGKGKFAAGSANAVAIGVFIDEDKKERLFLWSETVQLQGAGTRPASAKRATAKRSATKRSATKRSSAKRMTMKR